MIDPVGEDLRRLLAFTGLKIINIEVGDYNLIIHLKFKQKRFKLWIIGNDMILYSSEGVEICRVRPKCPTGTITSSNIPYTVYPYSNDTTTVSNLDSNINWNAYTAAGNLGAYCNISGNTINVP